MLRNTSVLSAGFISLIKQVFIVKEVNKGMSNSMKVSFCCKDCKRRMFDYYAGNLNLSIKCNRCKRVLTLKKIDEKYVAERMINGKLFV